MYPEDEATVPLTTPVEEVPDTIQIDPKKGTNNLLQPEVAENRAKRFTYAATSQNLSYEKILGDINSNREDNLRATTAMELDRRKDKMYNEFVQEYIKNNKGSITQPELDHLAITFKSMLSPTDVHSVFEEYYSQEVLKELAETGDPSLSNMISKAKTEIPAETRRVMQIGDEALAWSQFARTQEENWKLKAEHQSWLGWGADRAKELLTFGIYDEVQKRSNVDGTSWYEGGTLGANLSAQRAQLLKLPYEERKRALLELLNRTGKDNPALAYSIAKAMVGQSSKEQIMEDAMSAVTVATAPGVGGLAKMAAKQTILKETKEAVKHVITAADTAKPDGVAITAATGDFAGAATKKVLKDEVETTAGRANPTEQATSSLNSALNLQKQEIANNPGNFASGFIGKITEELDAFKEKFLVKLMDAQRVDRLNTVALTQVAVKSIKDNMAEKFPGIQNSIQDVGDVMWDKLTNTYHVPIKIGDNVLGQWTEKETAHNFATHHGFVDFEVKQQGMGWHIIVNKPLNETDDIIRDLIIETKNANKPQSWLGQYLTWLRTPEDTLSRANMENRKIATYTPSTIMQVFKDEMKYIQDLAKGVIKTDPITGMALDKPSRYWSVQRKERWDQWERTVKAGQDIRDPVTLEKGYFFKDPAELEYYYRNNFGRSPDTVEVEAYFAFKRITEADLFVRRLAMYRNKSRLGTESHQVSAIDEAGKIVQSEWIDGIKLNYFPGGKDESILVIKDTLRSSYVKMLEGDVSAKVKGLTGGISTAERKELKKGIEEGRYTVFEIFAPEHRPFANFSEKITHEHRPRYVIAPTVKTRSLRFEDQVPRRGGGHIEYDYDYYIKQANMRFDRATMKYWYEGDTTVMPISIRKMGHDVAQKLDAVRELLKKKDRDGARTLAAKTLPIDFKTIDGWFKDVYKDGKLVSPAKLSLDEKFQVVPKDKMINDMDAALEQRYQINGTNRFRDGTRSGSLNKQNQVEFTGKRDAEEVYTISNELGTHANPLYTYGLADTVDPMVTMNRAMSKIVSSLWMDDYKMTAVEQWLKDAALHLKAHPTELRSTPYYHFSTAKENYRPGTPKEVQQELEANRWKIQQFMGRKSPLQAQIDNGVDRFADWMYGKFGAGKLGTLAPELLAKTSDAPSFLRGVMFHTSMGLFSIPQAIVQSQSFVTIAAIAGYKHASSGTAATMMTQWARINKNPNIIKELDARLAKLHIPGTTRWKTGEFEESMKLLDSTGFGNVGGEYAMLDHYLTPKVIESGGKKFLDAGAVIFTEAERNVRYAAWHTAYKEFRELHPFGAIADKDVKKILDRADLLNANMSSASNSIMQHGFASAATQFFTYQFRMAEIFLGKRLGETLAERNLARFRLASWYAGIYGIPTSIAGTTGLPVADYIRKTAYDNGYIVGNNWASSLAMEGVPAFLMGFATGNGNPITDAGKRLRTGQWYNVADRYGMQGFEILREALYGDKGWYTLLGGAMASKGIDVGAATAPFFTWAASAMRDPKQAFEITPKHVMDVFAAAVSSANNTRRFIHAMYTNEWINRIGGTLEYDVAGKDAFFRSLTGLDLQSNTDVHLRSEITKEREKMGKEGLKRALQEWEAGHKAVEAGDQEMGATHRRNAVNILAVYGYPHEKFNQFMALANKGKMSIVDSVEWSQYTKDISDEQRKLMQDTFTRMQQIKKEKKQ